METKCKPVVEEYQELSSEQQCEQEFKGYEEIYSHTEEVCFADGKCENKDVYKKGNPVYRKVCKPVYYTRTRTVPRCEDVDVTRSEPVAGAYYQYDIEKWVDVKEVKLNYEEDTLESLNLPPGQKYSREEWKYYLHLADGTVYSVKREEFESRVVIVQSHFFGLWKTLKF